MTLIIVSIAIIGFNLLLMSKAQPFYRRGKRWGWLGQPSLGVAALLIILPIMNVADLLVTLDVDVQFVSINTAGVALSVTWLTDSVLGVVLLQWARDLMVLLGFSALGYMVDERNNRIRTAIIELGGDVEQVTHKGGK